MKQVIDLLKGLNGLLCCLRMTDAQAVADFRQRHGLLTQDFAKLWSVSRPVKEVLGLLALVRTGFESFDPLEGVPKLLKGIVS